ncbi:MAG: HAD family phosphatase [Synergistaceae bacterium]|nr:HAD family phosphatase [Synergistota bacterium]NLM70415.1 HAD family phosphatase [Synergistaceae bacterium]
MIATPIAFLAGEKRKQRSKPEAIKAIIFDLDGTLIDSEENHYESDRVLLARRGVTFSREDKRAFIGRGISEMVRRIKANYGLESDVQSLIDEKNAIYRSLALKSTRLYPPMRAVLEGFRERKLPMAIATGSNSGIAEDILKSLGIRDFFSMILSSSEVNKGKPEPDIFLETARRMGVEPQAVMAFEDTRFGVEAALRAGMCCVALPAPSDDGDAGVFDQADCLIKGGPDELDPQSFFWWFDTLTKL